MRRDFLSAYAGKGGTEVKRVDDESIDELSSNSAPFPTKYRLKMETSNGGHWIFLGRLIRKFVYVSLDKANKAG